MKLLGSSRSPYVVKTRLAIREKGVACEFVEIAAASAEVAAANPLGKVPTLVRDNGDGLYDSPVIVEYIDGLAARPKLIPDSFEDRIEVRRWEALGDGMIDALVAIAHNAREPENLRKDAAYVGKYEKKIKAALASMARGLGDRAFCHGEALTLADIACTAALAYLDRNLPDEGWRAIHPALARHYARLSARPSFAEATGG